MFGSGARVVRDFMKAGLGDRLHVAMLPSCSVAAFLWNDLGALSGK